MDESSFNNSYEEESIDKKKSISIIEQDEQSVKSSLKSNISISDESSEKAFKKTKSKKDVDQDEVSLIVPKNKIKQKSLSSKQKLIRNEKQTKDYTKLGISFDLKGVSINDADSSKMVALKSALKQYLLVKKEILDSYRKDKRKANVGPELIHKRGTTGFEYETDIYQALAKRRSGLTLQDEDTLREAYNRVQIALINYVSGKCIWFKIGRGRARLKQVKAVADMLQADNREFGLSETRSELYNTQESVQFDASHGIYPTYYGVLKNKDYIDKRHERLRREGRNNSLHLGWYGALIKDIGNWGLAAYHLAGGTALRTLAVPTMIAANAIEFVGKTAKVAMKGLSMVTNGIFRLFRSQKRWNIKVNKHTMTHGWTSLSDARLINLNTLFFLLGTPILTVKDSVHSLCRFLRNKFGPERPDKYVSDIWLEDTRRTRFILKRIFMNAKKNIRSFFGAEKPISDRADAEYRDIRREYDGQEDEDFDDED
ncbi:MAG: hypothetical protein IKO61_03010 [Lachnospiraceae bacterium]|nr:hypothetical protein [Lachnospiraceae bacterium]